jgi:hypothetical protein
LNIRLELLLRRKLRIGACILASLLTVWLALTGGLLLLHTLLLAILLTLRLALRR